MEEPTGVWGLTGSPWPPCWKFHWKTAGFCSESLAARSPYNLHGWLSDPFLNSDNSVSSDVQLSCGLPNAWPGKCDAFQIQPDKTRGPKDLLIGVFLVFLKCGCCNLPTCECCWGTLGADLGLRLAAPCTVESYSSQDLVHHTSGQRSSHLCLIV